MTIVELITGADGYLGSKGVDVDKHKFMTPAETAALEAECREKGLIK